MDHIKQKIKGNLTQALKSKLFRQALLRAPLFSGSMGVNQLKGIELAKVCAASMEERSDFESLATQLREKLGGNLTLDLTLIEPASRPRTIGDTVQEDVDLFVSILKNSSLDEEQRTIKFRELSNNQIQNVASTVLVDLHKNFLFDARAFESVFERYVQTQNSDLFFPLLELAPDLGSAMAVLNTQSGMIFDGREPLNPDQIIHREAHKPLDLIIVDNQIDLEIAEVLCRRFCPKARVLFSNRVAITAAFSKSASSVIKSWQPLIEGTVAYYTDAEEALDKEFLAWLKSDFLELDKLFNDPRSGKSSLASFGSVGRDILKFLLEDATYLRFREHFAWRTAILSCTKSENVLLLSKRADMMKSLRQQGCFERLKHLSIWGIHPMQRADTEVSPRNLDFPTPLVKPDISKMRHSYRAKTVEDLARHYETNVAKSPKPKPIIIMMTSSNPCYLEYSLSLVKKLGVDNCILFDVNPFGVNKGAIARASELNVQYRATSYMTSYEGISAWEQELVDMIFATIQSSYLKVHDKNQNIISALLSDEAFLKPYCIYFLRAYEQFLFMSNYIERSAKFIDDSELDMSQPLVFFMPGRLPVSYTLAKHKKNIKTVDLQFFWNSYSFRYRKPVASYLTTIDDVDFSLYQRQTDVGGTKLIKLGSPSIDSYYGQTMLINRNSFNDVTVLSSVRNVLVVGQPNSFELWYPILEAVKQLVTVDPRIVISIKLHPQNSHGTREVFRAILGEGPLRNVKIYRDGEIYNLLLETDVAIGWSSNSLIEAAALTKGVFLIQQPFVEEYMKEREVGKIIRADKIAAEILSYFDSESRRLNISKIQSTYFNKNPGMDPFNSSYDLTDTLMKAIKDKPRRTARKKAW